MRQNFAVFYNFALFPLVYRVYNRSMEVYIEYVVIDNLVVDYLLLLITRKTLRLRVSKFSVVFSALVGTVVAVCLPTFKMNKGFTYTVKIILGAIIVLFSGEFNSVKEYIRAYYLFIFYTFLFGGCVFGVFYFLNIDFNAVEFCYNAEFSLGAILFTAYILYLSAYKLVGYIYRKREALPYIRKCVISFKGKEFALNGFIDSGNRLFSNRTGFPIILCSSKIGKKLLHEGLFDGVKSETIGFYTATGKSYLKIYNLESLKIYNGDKPNKIYNVKMGVSPTDFVSDGEYDLLLSPALI